MNNSINLNSRNTLTIHQLRRAGWKVRVIHGYVKDLSKTLENYFIISKLSERYTRIEITCPKKFNAFGETFCSNKDQYNRKLGNRIALARALKNYQDMYN